MGLLLELVRLHLTGVDQERFYTASIREHLDGNRGRPAADWRAVRDSRQPGRRVSTSTLRAWVA